MKLKKRHKIREISWLSFNERVLQEAEDGSVPLIERIKFLGIFSSNLDEFFRVRIATLRRLANLKNKKNILDINPDKVLDKIHRIVISQQKKFDRIYKKILVALAKEKINIINEKQLSYTQARFVRNYFHQQVLPTLVPVMIDKIKDFPFLKDKSIYLIIQLVRKNHNEKSKLALIEIPADRLSRFLILPRAGDSKYIILLDDVIRFCLQDIFYIFNFDHYDAWIIKLTRDAELNIDQDIAGGIVEKLSQSLNKRKKGAPVRFVYDSSLPQGILQYLIKRIHLNKKYLIAGSRYHNFKDFINFPDTGRTDLVYEKINPVPHKYLRPGKSILKTLKDQDCILHLPYQSFDYVIQLLREATLDPKVKSIKIALYRVAQNSNIVNALINAAKNGKSVTVVMELQARFDEEANIFWAKRLEEEGVRVIYGVPGLKVHCKMLVISRHEKGKLKHYINIGTGNYHEDTARQYCDHSLFTADQRIASEAYKVFRFLEDKKKPSNFEHLLVAPFDMRKKFMKLIEHEIKNAKEGKEAFIIIKVNHIVDREIIQKLYEASRAGIKIDMIVRTTCSLIPGIKDVSSNIRVISIVDRFLEHARVFIFGNAGNPKYYLSSSDLMARNLDSRVEIAFPVYDEEIQSELKEIIEIQLNDNTKARIINAQQDNRYRKSKSITKVRAQFEIFDYLRSRVSY
jgi:polyphosphate kinase